MCVQNIRNILKTHISYMRNQELQPAGENAINIQGIMGMVMILKRQVRSSAVSSQKQIARL